MPHFRDADRLQPILGVQPFTIGMRAPISSRVIPNTRRCSSKLHDRPRRRAIVVIRRRLDELRRAGGCGTRPVDREVVVERQQHAGSPRGNVNRCLGMGGPHERRERLDPLHLTPALLRSRGLRRGQQPYSQALIAREILR